MSPNETIDGRVPRQVGETVYTTAHSFRLSIRFLSSAPGRGARPSGRRGRALKAADGCAPPRVRKNVARACRSGRRAERLRAGERGQNARARDRGASPRIRAACFNIKSVHTGNALNRTQSRPTAMSICTHAQTPHKDHKTQLSRHIPARPAPLVMLLSCGERTSRFGDGHHWTSRRT